jgi:hypothetical protein
LTVLKKRPEIRTRFRLEAAYVKANPWKYKKSSIDTCIVFGMATGGSDDKQAAMAGKPTTDTNTIWRTSQQNRWCTKKMLMWRTHQPPRH